MSNIQSAVEQLSTFGALKIHKITGDYYICTCPYHSDGNEKRPSSGILLRDTYRAGKHYPAGWFHCFTCGTVKTFRELVKDVWSKAEVDLSCEEFLEENAPEFSESEEFDALVPQGVFDLWNNQFALDYIKQFSNQQNSYVSEEELKSYRYTVPYMYERKLTDEIIAKYDVGVDMHFIPPGRKREVPCITFPVRDIDGNTLFFVRRSIKGKFFNYPDGVVKPVYGLYELPKGTKEVVVCESCFNALTAVAYGYPAVALLGTGNSLQLDQLKQMGAESYVLAFDGDEAGRKATNKLKKALKSVGMVWTIKMPDGKDVNDCTKEEFDKLYSERE